MVSSNTRYLPSTKQTVRPKGLPRNTRTARSLSLASLSQRLPLSSWRRAISSTSSQESSSIDLHSYGGLLALPVTSRGHRRFPVERLPDDRTAGHRTEPVSAVRRRQRDLLRRPDHQVFDARIRP